MYFSMIHQYSSPFDFEVVVLVVSVFQVLKNSVNTIYVFMFKTERVYTKFEPISHEERVTCLRGGRHRQRTDGPFSAATKS